MINRFIIAISIIFTAHFCVYGMKRAIETATGESLITLPDELIKKIVADAFHNQPINIPQWYSFFPEQYNIHISLSGSVAWIARMRSVCKHWYNLLQPSDIKRIMNVDTEDIVADLAQIRTGDYKDYSRAKFLAQMIKNQLDVGDRIVSEITKKHDLEKIDCIDCDKLNILRENGLVSPYIVYKLKWDIFINKFNKENIMIASVLTSGLLFSIRIFYEMYSQGTIFVRLPYMKNNL